MRILYVRRGGSNFSVEVTKGNERWRAEWDGKDGLRNDGRKLREATSLLPELILFCNCLSSLFFPKGLFTQDYCKILAF